MKDGGLLRRLKSYPVMGGNSLQHWTRFRSPLRVLKNFLVIQICRYAPSLTLKRWLAQCLLGMNVGQDFSWGLMAMVDVFWPELIWIGNNTILGYNSTILCHEFLIHELRLGEVRIGSGVMIGANATVLPGVSIGDGAVVAAGAMVNRDVLPGEFVGGVPIRTLEPKFRED